MCRILRIPPTLDKVFCPVPPCFHGDHGVSSRWLVRVLAMAWGRRQVVTRDRDSDAAPHRTRVNNFWLVARWDPAAALRQQAQARRRSLHLRPGETLDVVMDDAQKATRGKAMEAVATRQEPPTEGDRRGHQDVCALLGVRAPVIPGGIRRSVQPAPAQALGLPCDKTTELAGQRIRELKAPVGVTVMGRCEAYSLCHTVGKAGREQPVHVAATLKSQRRRFKQGWKRNAGRYGKHLFRRRRTQTCGLATPQGAGGDRVVDAGGLTVSPRGQLPGVFSRTGHARTLLGRVTDAPALAGAGLLRTDAKRWAVESFFTASQPLLGLGQSQHRPYGAAVTHLLRVGLASALLTHLRLERDGAQGQRTPHQAANMSVATAQEALRWLLWDDLVASLNEKPHGEAVLAELERLRVA